MENGKIARVAVIAALALLVLANSGWAIACQSYGEACGSGCCPGLACDSKAGKCTQQPLSCDMMPAAYSAPAPQDANPDATGSPASAIASLESGSGLIRGSSGIYQAGWFSDWRTTGIAGLVIAISIIAIAAMVGHGFDLPEIRAFASAELSQAVVSAMLIFAIMGLILFFDIVAREAVAAGSLPVTCDPSGNEPCYLSVAKQYLTNLYDVGNDYAKNSLQESFDNQKKASSGLSAQFNVWWAAFAGTSSRPNAGWAIKAERAGVIFENVSRLLASIYAQRYFLEVISFGIAPIFLLLGIILRTFFFTRKLGGLLLAAAISLFIVYPLTYAFAWYTLNVTLYGERTIEATDPKCPAECTARYPAAFYVQNDGGSGRIVQFETTQDIVGAGIDAANWEQGGPGGNFPGLVACRDLSGAGLPESVAPSQCAECPDYCRETPFPTLPGCDINKCSACNAGCKIMRQRTDCAATCQNCGASCRTTQPVENKCFFTDEKAGSARIRPANLSVSCAGCAACPTWCKILSPGPGGELELLNKDPQCDIAACKTATMGGTCPLQCLYVTQFSESTSCDASCTYQGTECPKNCRILDLYAPEIREYDTGNMIESACSSPAVMAACSVCPADCKIGIRETPQDYFGACAAFPTVSSPEPTSNCLNCPDYCRYDDYSFIQPSSNTKMTEVDGQRVPLACTGKAEGSNREILCSSAGNPPECGANCKIASPPPSSPQCSQYLGEGAGSSDCRLCPENCRIAYADGSVYAGSCGEGENADCSLNSCPLSCRTLVEKSPQYSSGDPLDAAACYSLAEDKPCLNCPAFCRRASGDLPPDAQKYCDSIYCGDYDPETQWGCTAECRLPESPDVLCEACTQCATDCLYYPATRTDCAELCTDESLAGQLNVEPADYIKKLPGAEGDVDVKNLGALMVPALVLPLFCIVIVVAFIRVLSPVLGGDIEIPGLGRII